jgi:hypothetical protein
MSPFRFLLLALALGVLAPLGAKAGIVAYAEPGKTDFDTAMPILNPYGTWSKIDDKWAYTPLDHYTPYTSGRWLYTEYGWTWSGTRPESWLTEHYGYWKRDANQVWSWYPGPFWLPQTVELRESGDYIGWRSGEVDAGGSFVEAPEQRHAKPDEWTFVTRAQFAGPIRPGIVAPPDKAASLLDDSTESLHTYFTYREIDRVGPHPADFLGLGDGGMFPPLSLQERYELERAAELAKASAAAKGAATPGATNTATAPALPDGRQAPAAPSGLVSTPARGTPVAPAGLASTSPGTNAAAADPDAPDMRQVRYWIAMNLPNAYAKRPPDAKVSEVYIYRPDFFQDNDGIGRRITLWLDPASQSQETMRLSALLGGNVSPATVPAVSAAATAAPPAAPSRDPFHSEFEDPQPRTK